MNVMIVGDAKLGKSYSIATLRGCTVVCNLDPGGYTSIRRSVTLAAPGTLELVLRQPHEDIIVVDYCMAATPAITVSPDRKERHSPGEETYRRLIADINTAIANVDVVNLVIDGLTGLGDVVLNAVLALNKRAKPVYEDWGQSIDKLNEIVSVCAANRPAFVLLCHIQTDKDEITGRVKESPLVYGKQLPNKLMALFDNVFAAGYSNGRYYWVTRPQPLMPTIGSRAYDDLPERIQQNFSDLFTGQTKGITNK